MGNDRPGKAEGRTVIAGFPVVVWIAAVLAVGLIVLAYTDSDNRWEKNP